MLTKASLAVSEGELCLHRTRAVLRGLPFFRRHYPINLHSGLPIREFVRLADACAKLGVPVLAHRQVGEYLKQGRPVLKFGKTDMAEDVALLARSSSCSEWNLTNLETIGEYPHYLDLERKTWNIHLGTGVHNYGVPLLPLTLIVHNYGVPLLPPSSQPGFFMDHTGGRRSPVARLTPEPCPSF